MKIKPCGLLMIITLFFGCSHYIPKSTSITPSTIANDNNTLLDTAINMGHDIIQDIQNVFWFAGDMLSSMLGQPIVMKADDKRSKIRDHFDKVSNELNTIKGELKNKTYEDESSAKVANNIIDKIITAVTKIAKATDANMSIGEIKKDSRTKASLISNKQSVQDIIDGIKEIVNIAESSGIKFDKKDDDNTPISASSNSDAPAALNGGGNNNAGADQKAGSELAKAISETDSWTMIDKIRNSTTTTDNISNKNDNNAGQLITGYTNTDKGAGAKTKADLAAAVALKAMSKDGQFAAYKTNHNNEEYVKKIQEAASEAVNKVLKTLDIIIKQTLKNALNKVKIKN